MASLKQNDDDDREETSTDHPSIDIAKLARQSYDASRVRRMYDEDNDDSTVKLSHVPWKLNYNDSTSSSFLPLDYLEIRRLQNNHWATRRLQEGVEYAKKGDYVKAQKTYQEGLDLCTRHTGLLVAMGALCANQGDATHGIEYLQQALEIDPQTANAQDYLTAILQKQQEQQQQEQQQVLAQKHQQAVRKSTLQPNRKSTTLTLRTDHNSALQDAMAESALTGGGVSGSITEYPMLSPSSSDEEERKKKKRRKKHKKKKKRKRKRRYYSSDESSSSDEEEERRRRRRKRKRKHEKASPPLSNDESSSPARRRRHDSE